MGKVPGGVVLRCDRVRKEGNKRKGVRTCKESRERPHGKAAETESSDAPVSFLYGLISWREESGRKVTTCRDHKGKGDDFCHLKYNLSSSLLPCFSCLHPKLGVQSGTHFLETEQPAFTDWISNHQDPLMSTYSRPFSLPLILEDGRNQGEVYD